LDIKLKRIKYSSGTKIVAAIMVWLCFMGATLSGMFLIYNENNLATSNYFETNNFRGEFDRLVHNVVELNTKLISEENIKSSGGEEYIVADKMNRLYLIKDRISSTVNFAYYIKNTQTGDSITNITNQDAVSLIKEQPTFVYMDQWKADSNYPLYDDIRQMLAGTPYEVYAAVVEPLKEGDVFYDYFEAYSRIKGFLPYAIVLLIISTILMITAFIYLVSVIGRKEKGGEIVLSFIDRIFTDVHTFLVFIAAVISVAIAGDTFHGNRMIAFIFISIILSIDVFIGLSYILSMVRQIKKGQIIKNSLAYRLYSELKTFATLCFNGKIFRVWTLCLLLGYGGINGILFTITTHSYSSGSLILALLTIAFNAAAVYFTAKALLSLTQIMGAAKEICAGNLDYHLDSSKISIAFLGFAEDIKSIQGGLKGAVAEAVKGERMKTDLITNVSHDLKTPLTSIINYVDLLKREELGNEKAHEYVGILEEKSGRLKQLVEDLIEASKASSGNLAVKGEKVDLNELVMQACGEYEEKIKNAELDVRINSADKKALVFADGKHMWRIVENLLSNVIKYSMRNSRVYINIDKSDIYGMLTVKNISAFPLDISPEQLTERFVRGDASRTAEGSGLGLSIAQSLTRLQGGMFNIDIDGDLFKVTVEIPLWHEKEE